MSSLTVRDLDGLLGGPLVLSAALAVCWLAVCRLGTRSTGVHSPEVGRRRGFGRAGAGPSAQTGRRGDLVRTSVAVLGTTGLIGTVAATAAVPAAGVPLPDTGRSGDTVQVAQPLSGDQPLGPTASPGDATGPDPTLWPVGPERRAERVAPADDPDTVVVRRGDSLWSLAAASLGRGASAAAIWASVQRWHSLNRAVIGADPDLIRPGQVLRVPSPWGPATAPWSR